MDEHFRIMGSNMNGQSSVQTKVSDNEQNEILGIIESTNDYTVVPSDGSLKR